MFTQLLEELAKIGEEIASKIEVSKELEAKVEELTSQNEQLKQEIENHVCAKCDHSALEKEIADLKQQIAEHVCPTCNHEEEIEVLNKELVSIKAENEQLKAEHEENTKALQAEIERLKKLLATS